MIARFPLLIAAAGLLHGLAGCPSGRQPPEITPLIKVPGGTFTLGSTELICGDQTTQYEIQRCDSGNALADPTSWIQDLTWVPPATATVSDVEIDAHEVTNAQYELCVENDGCTPLDYTEVGGEPYYGNPDYANHPVVYVSWQQASDYCQHVGRRLPTEAQWERAARLDRAGKLRTYPWEGTKESNCNPGKSYYAISTLCPAAIPPAVDYSQADVTDYGLQNMASGVAEWVKDGWHTYAYCEGREEYDPTCQKSGTACAECQQDGSLCAGSCQPSRLVICKAGAYAPYEGNATEKVVRGGSYMHSRCYQRLFVRHKGIAPGPEIGFRCVQ